jgi:hypothetical protein
MPEDRDTSVGAAPESVTVGVGETARRPRSNRTGPGFHRKAPSPEEIAIRLERMRAGQRAAAERKREYQQAALDLQGLAAMPLHEVRRRVGNRHFEVALYWIGGYSYEVIARTLGYASRGQVMRILRRPEVAALIEKVRTAQLERAIAGEFGVRVQAKAAAPRVMTHVIEKAGGIEGKQAAAKDADMLRAADMVFDVAGETGANRPQVHVHTILRDLTREELADLVHHDRWPERWQSVVGGMQRAALPAPDDATA